MACGALGVFLALPGSAGGCVAESGGKTAALVELYTAHGCARCLAAERRIAELKGDVVPIMLYLHDPELKRDAIVRERRLTPRQRLALTSVPLVLLQGREFPEFHAPALEEAIATINARPAPARLRLEIVGTEGAALAVRARAALGGEAPLEQTVLFLAAHEAGRVDQWLGPIAVREPTQVETRVLPARSARGGAVAFLANRHSREVLQAVTVPACP